MSNSGTTGQAEGSRDQGISRQTFSRARFLLGSGAAAAAAVAVLSPLTGPAAPVQAAPAFNLDVTWDGPSFQYDNPVLTAPKRGSTFVVSGKIFPEGTFAKGPTNPNSPGSIGTWISRGTFLLSLDEIFKGAAPHTVATHHFIFDDGSILVSEGFQGGARVTRVITGGAGRFAGARGTIIEDDNGTNNTTLALAPGVAIPSLSSVFTVNIL